MAAVMREATPKSASARAALSAAIERKQAAEAAVEQNAAAVEQARAAVKAVESHVALFDDLDNRIAAARAEMVKRGESGALPAGLVAEREARRAARENLDECSGALALLEKQLDEAEKARIEAMHMLNAAALDVMLDEGAALANELSAATKLEWHLADSLYALDLVVTGQACPLPPDVAGPLRLRLGRLLGPLRMQKHELPATAPNNPLRLQGEKWQAAFALLKRDPKTPVRTVWED